MGVFQRHSGQTRASLARKQRAGMDAESLLREKRMGDLAWQMTVTAQKLKACPREKRSAKERLDALYRAAKAEYEHIKMQIELEADAVENGVYLG